MEMKKNVRSFKKIKVNRCFIYLYNLVYQIASFRITTYIQQCNNV